MITPAFTVCACADPWCREHGCRLANGLKYGVQPNYGPAYVVPNVPRPLTNDDLARAYDMGRDMERAAVVAYLKSLADAAGQADAFWQGVASGNGYAAQMIESGEHRA